MLLIEHCASFAPKVTYLFLNVTYEDAMPVHDEI
jgi:hypothetical protein